MILLDLRPNNISGKKVEKICDLVNITINKNSVPGDKSALSPGGIRLGTSSLTTRGFDEDDFTTVGHILHETIQTAIHIQDDVGKSFIKFTDNLNENTHVDEIRTSVLKLSGKYN